MNAPLDPEAPAVSPPSGSDGAGFRARVEALPTSRRDPNPWLAVYLDQSLPLDPDAKAALVLDSRSWSRQFLLPLVRPLARTFIVLFQLLKTVVPNAFTSSWLLHRLIYWGLKWFVAPEANFLILRHFHVGTQLLAFLRTNLPVEIPSHPLTPERLEDVKADLFLQHDLNLYNFVIDLNRALAAGGGSVRAPERLDFSAITDGPFPLQPFPRRWTNFVDVATAIELYTPLYQLFLTDSDFWRASNSLQLDETVGLYVARLLNDASHLALVNNKHPLVPLSTLKAGSRLVLHGLSAEALHRMLVLRKRAQAEADRDLEGTAAGAES
jgi:hypothetical protein